MQEAVDRCVKLGQDEDWEDHVKYANKLTSIRIRVRTRENSVCLGQAIGVQWNVSYPSTSGPSLSATLYSELSAYLVLSWICVLLSM